MMKRTLISAAALLALAAGSVNAQVVVTTGAGYIKMVNALTQAYQAQTDKEVAKAVGGNIGQMLAQVAQGNGVNLVISDTGALDKFQAHLGGDRLALGDTPLVMIWRKGLSLKSPEAIVEPDVKTVAHPDPKAAIYGRSAAKWLKNTGIGEKIKDKIRSASSVPQVYSYVATGNMDVGFVNLLAYRNAPEKVAGHFEIRDHGAIIHMAAQPVKGAENDADVKDFMKFLGTPKAHAIMDKFGVTMK